MHYQKSKDLTGQRFGRWFVRQFVRKNQHGQYMYLCQCDCGVEREVNGSSLRSGLTKSCRCLNREKLQSIKRNIPTLPPYIAAFNRLFCSYQASAKIRNLSFLLTEDEFRILTNGYCKYCGDRPSQVRSSPGATTKYIYNGVDRVNNDIGYEWNNCVSCCKTCNRMKLAMGIEVFLDHIRKIFDFSIKENYSS